MAAAASCERPEARRAAAGAARRRYRAPASRPRRDPVSYRDFAGEDEAPDHAIANQRDRRNLDDGELFRPVEAADRRRGRGGDHKSDAARSKTSGDAFDPASSVQTAEVTGTSPRKVEKVRAIFDYAEETGDT
jgi:hypothetical protein